MSTTIAQPGRILQDLLLKVFVLLSTGLRREELVNLKLRQLSPDQADELRQVERAQIHGLPGIGTTQREVFLSRDARHALADYLEKEHDNDVSNEDSPLFLVAIEAKPRRPDGCLSTRSVNLILEKIGRWHDAGIQDEALHISPLRPHDLRHSFACRLARTAGTDRHELERRLGHRAKRYIEHYLTLADDVAASCIEDF